MSRDFKLKSRDQFVFEYLAAVLQGGSEAALACFPNEQMRPGAAAFAVAPGGFGSLGSGLGGTGGRLGTAGGKPPRAAGADGVAGRSQTVWRVFSWKKYLCEKCPPS